MWTAKPTRWKCFQIAFPLGVARGLCIQSTGKLQSRCRYLLKTRMHSSRMRTGCSLTVCQWGAWIWSPSISPLGVGLDLIPLNFPLGVGLDLIPLNFPLGCGPGSDPPQFPPWVWALRGSPSWGVPPSWGVSFQGGLPGRGSPPSWGGGSIPACT